MNKSERVIIFIDGSNFYHMLKDTFGDSKKLIDFDFNAFARFLVNGRKHIRTYYYSAPLDKKRDEETYSKQQRFFEKLKKLPDFELILCRMQKRKYEGETLYQVKEDDIHIAVDMVKFAYNNAYDTAILVSTDGDFIPAVNAVKEKGKRVENIGFDVKFSWHLKQKCDRFSQLSKKDLSQFFRITR